MTETTYNGNPFKRYISGNQVTFGHNGNVRDDGSVDHKFEKSNKFGKLGEAIVMSYLSSGMIPAIESVRDVSKNSSYRAIDVDAIVRLRNKKGAVGDWLCEIKADTYKDNIFYETVSDIQKGTLGCMLVTKCNFLCYYYINLDMMYVISMRKYREWVDSVKHKPWVKTKTVHNVDDDGHEYWSEGYAIPRYRLEQAVEKGKYLHRIERVRQSIGFSVEDFLKE